MKLTQTNVRCTNEVLCERAQAGDSHARNQLLVAVEPQIQAAARRVRLFDNAREPCDIAQFLRLDVNTMIDTYDTSNPKGAKFTTYIYTGLQRGVYRTGARESNYQKSEEHKVQALTHEGEWHVNRTVTDRLLLTLLLSHLNLRQRQACLLSHQGYTQEQIAAEAEVHVATTRKDLAAIKAIVLHTMALHFSPLVKTVNL